KKWRMRSSGCARTKPASSMERCSRSMAGEQADWARRGTMKRILFGWIVCGSAGLTGCASQSQDLEQPQSYSASIGYANVPEAQAVLTARAEGATSVGEDGWT